MMHKRGNELVTLIHGLELTINVSCTDWNVKYFKACRSDVISDRTGAKSEAIRCSSKIGRQIKLRIKLSLPQIGRVRNPAYTLLKEGTVKGSRSGPET